MNKDKFIISWNLAGFAWKISEERWGDRLERACDYIKETAPDAWVMGLSEVIPGKGNKYIDILKKEFPNYHIILPKAYADNYRSAINVLLVNKEGYHDHTVRTLDNLEDSLLYNYIGLDCDYGYYRILSVHMPHTNNDDRPKWYQRNRYELRKVFENTIKETCAAYRRETDVQYIFMGDLNATPDGCFVKSLVGPVNPMLFDATRGGDREVPTWSNPEYSKNHIDYICYSMGSMMAPVIDVYYNEIITEPITDLISDHALLRGKIRTNIDNWCA